MLDIFQTTKKIFSLYKQIPAQSWELWVGNHIFCTGIYVKHLVEKIIQLFYKDIPEASTTAPVEAINHVNSAKVRQGEGMTLGMVEKIKRWDQRTKKRVVMELQFIVSGINSKLFMLRRCLDGDSLFGSTSKDAIEAIINRHTQGYGMPAPGQVEVIGVRLDLIGM